MGTLLPAACWEFSDINRFFLLFDASPYSIAPVVLILVGFLVADRHGTPKVNVWQDPMSPSRWKEERVSAVEWSMIAFGLMINRLLVSRTFPFFSFLFSVFVDDHTRT